MAPSVDYLANAPVVEASTKARSEAQEAYDRALKTVPHNISHPGFKIEPWLVFNPTIKALAGNLQDSYTGHRFRPLINVNPLSAEFSLAPMLDAVTAIDLVTHLDQAFFQQSIGEENTQRYNQMKLNLEEAEKREEAIKTFEEKPIGGCRLIKTEELGSDTYLSYCRQVSNFKYAFTATISPIITKKGNLIFPPMALNVRRSENYEPTHIVVLIPVLTRDGQIHAFGFNSFHNLFSQDFDNGNGYNLIANAVDNSSTLPNDVISDVEKAKLLANGTKLSNTLLLTLNQNLYINQEEE